MKQTLLVFALIISFGAISQVQAPKQDKKVSIVLTVAEVDVVLNALQSLPYKDAAGVIQSIYGQAQAQLQPDTSKSKGKPQKN